MDLKYAPKLGKSSPKLFILFNIVNLILVEKRSQKKMQFNTKHNKHIL